MSKSVVRSMKNITKGYSSVEVKVRNATSNDAWGPSGTEMAEIAQLTFNAGDFQEIMDMLDKRLNDKGKNWRHVLKSLKVLDYCLHEGSEHVVTWARNNIYIIKTLREFQYTDEESRDVGLNVRQSAKELTSLIIDEDRLRSERKDRKNWKSRVTGLDDGPGPAFGGAASSPARSRANTRDPRQGRPVNDDNDLEFRLALEASKNEMEEERKRREGKPPAATAPVDDDDDLRKAIQLSQEEDELRRKELEESNATSLFDDTPARPQQPQQTGYNMGYQQQAAVDFFGNPIDQQQTGYLNNAYAQQPQQTGFQNGYGNYAAYQQPQQTGYMMPQQTGFNVNNPYSAQNPNFGEQQPLQNQPTLQPGSNNPWASSTPQQSNNAFEALKPTPTGSNNPFAANRPAQQPAAQRAPTLSTLQEQRTAVQTHQPQNDQHAHLNALLASGEGMDTFGNTGNMRIPAHHTAPGLFINSAGQQSNRLVPNQTGSTNPFLSNQFTGMPNTTTPQPQQQQHAQQQQLPHQQFPQQQNFMQPAQTGGAWAYGGQNANSGGFGAPQPIGAASNNPFGAAREQQGGGQQGGSLIDF